jgi:hypothetical protein
VTAAPLIIDSSLSASEAELVRPGDRVAIQQPDGGVRTRGVVGQVDRIAGTRGVGRGRVYLSVIPAGAPRWIPGTPVRITIAVDPKRRSESAAGGP